MAMLLLSLWAAVNRAAPPTPSPQEWLHPYSEPVPPSDWDIAAQRIAREARNLKGSGQSSRVYDWLLDSRLESYELGLLVLWWALRNPITVPSRL